MEGDCISFIKMVTSGQISDIVVGFFIREILTFVENFDLVSWSFVKRVSNRVAHDLTHRKSYSLEEVLWESQLLKTFCPRSQTICMRTSIAI